MTTVEKRHLIRKRSRERSEIKTVEASKLYQEAIKQVMEGRAEIMRCYKVIRQLQSSVTIYQAAMSNRINNDQEDHPTDAVVIEARPQEPAAAPGQE